MIKHIKEDLSVVFSEIPDEITLAFNISNCQNCCINCHTPYLRQNIGEELTEERLETYIKNNSGISCVCFMGEGNDREALLNLAQFIRTKFPELKLAIYSGRVAVEDDLYNVFDFIKIGPYVELYGPIDTPTTNQRLYKNREDITYKFWK